MSLHDRFNCILFSLAGLSILSICGCNGKSYAGKSNTDVINENIALCLEDKSECGIYVNPKGVPRSTSKLTNNERISCLGNIVGRRNFRLFDQDQTILRCEVQNQTVEYNFVAFDSYSNYLKTRIYIEWSSVPGTGLKSQVGEIVGHERIDPNL